MSQAAKQPGTDARFYDFGPFRVDAVSRLLIRDAEIVPVTSKVFDVLLMFVSNTGRMFDKDEMMKRLWPDSFVEEGNLTRNVSMLRKALGESPHEHQYIVTVPGRGYRFVASVRAIADENLNLITYERASLKVVVEEEHAVSEVEEPQAKPMAVPAVATRLGIKLRRRLLIPLIAISFVLTAAAGIYLIRKSKPESPLAFRQITMTSLTSTGDVYAPVISPDGKYLAYCSLEYGLAGLRVRQVATGSVVQVVPAAPVQYWGISFSRDSEYIYYGIGNTGPDQKGTLYRVPALGGHPEKLLSECAGVCVSKDGQHLAYGRVTSTQRHEIVVTDKDAKNEYIIPSIAERNMDIRSGDWSPDGKSFACVVRNRSADGPSWYVSEFPIEGVGEKVIVPPRKTRIIMVVWLADNSGLIMSAIDPETRVGQLSFISYPGGEERRLTHDLTDYNIITATADGRTIVAQKRESLSQLWIAPSDDPSQGRVLLTTTGLAYHYLSWTPDNHVVFDVEETGIDIWKVSTDGSGGERLTYRQGQNREPSLTPDGRYVVFVSTRTGSSQVWRMDADGNNPKQLTSSSTSVAEPRGAPDGESVLYTSELQGRTRLLKIPIDGGKPGEVIDDTVDFWAISPDGKLLAYSYHDNEALKTRVAVVPLAGGPPLERFDLDPSYVMRWTTDGRALMYIAPGDNIWIQPIAGGAPKQLTHFQRELELVSFASSPDGKQIVYSRGRNNWDAVAFRIK
jgi:Tol biopolymer transport system component/DNA-binding winged helix-turn-helix (wHTH) protein